MKIHLLNHASIIIDLDEVKILFDPWFTGTCFEGGWGLKFNNPECLELSKQCTHLWISHFHTDHFHTPTLKKILEINPEIIVLGNHSFNFCLDDATRRLGFKNVISFFERTKINLSEKISVIRYPTTGIDNMLLVEYDDVKILNYNDCNLPKRAIDALANKIGKIDILLNNYNHAGKMLDHPLPLAETIKENLKKNFIESSNIFSPKFILPFASHHYYRAKESQEQNESLLSKDELLALDDKIVDFNIGDTLIFNENLNVTWVSSSSPITLNKMDVLIRNDSKSFTELCSSFIEYAVKIRRSFLYLTFWIPDLNIKVEDLNIVVSLNLKKGLKILPRDAEYHIITTSEALYLWFNKPYGLDGFWIGAHFDINKSNIFPLRWQLLVGLLSENRLDLVSIIKMFLSASGIRFLWNRREEIKAILLGLKFNVGLRK